MKIFEALKEDHKTQRSLANSLLRTAGETDERKSMFDQLVTELKAHAIAEERFFYKPMMEFDQSQEKARHSISEHHEIDELIEKLEDTEMSSSEWMPNFEKLRELVFHHLDEEENEVFQVAGKVMSEAEKEKFGDNYQILMEQERKKF